MNNNIKNPKLSIIVPVFNVEAYLKKCIDSILNQTFQDFELLLINDGSSDNSKSILDQYLLKDRRIRVFHKINSGVSSTRNIGIQNACGQWICFIDSDDWIEPNHLEEFFKVKLNQKMIVFQGILFDYTNFTKPFFIYDNIIIDKNDSKKIAKYQLLNNGCPFCKLFNREIIIKNDLKFDTNLSIHEDHCFIWSYLKHIDKIILRANISYHYMQYPTGISLTRKKHNSMEWLYASESLIGYFEILKTHFKISPKYENLILSKYGIGQLYSAAINTTESNYISVFSALKKKTKLMIRFNKKSYIFRVAFIMSLYFLPSNLMFKIISKRNAR